MALFGKRSDHKVTKIFFVTDVHGSETTFRKFLNAGRFYGVDTLILGGDVSGKMVVPILQLGESSWRATMQGMAHEFGSAQEVAEFEKRAAKLGYYSAVVSREEYAGLTADPAAVDGLYHRLAAERLGGWIELAEERLEGSGIRMYVTGGNDDSVDVLDVVAQRARANVIACEDRIVALDEAGHRMISLGLSNPTPWQTPREVPEEVLEAHIEEMVAGIDDFARVIFNFHVPPVDSTLDTCPKLDASTDPPRVVTAGGTPVLIGAGSTAVRRAIERYQPMLSLHGHIHESRGEITIGRTVALNPGSEYGEGVLRGAIVTLDGDAVQSVQMTSG